MGEENKRTYTIRVSDQVATRLEEAARTSGITPTSLIQSVVSHKFRSPESADREVENAAQAVIGAKLENLRKSFEHFEEQDRTGLEQLRFEM